MTTKPTAQAALTWRAVTARRMARHALAELVGEPATLTVGTVTVGAHA